MDEPNEQKGKRQQILKFLAGFVLGFMIVALLFSVCSLMYGRSSGKLAKQAICGSNLNGIGKGIVIYASENNDLFPPDLATLAPGGYYISPKELVCPASGTKPSPTTQPADVESHCDYIYVSGWNWDTPGSVILAFELPANHGQEAVNALYTDAHVTFHRDMSKFAGELQRLNDYQVEERGAER